jgi:hypothetical protein
VPAEEVEPLELLVNTHSQSDISASNPSKIYSRATEPVTVSADVMEISVEQIIEAEGRREPDSGFDAKKIRQAWIYVYKDEDQKQLYYPLLNNLEQLQTQWPDFFSEATGGRGEIEISE